MVMTWNNTLVYSCECVCFVLLSYCVNVFFYVLCCLMLIDMFHIQMQLLQRLDQWNEYLCMNVYMYVLMSIQLKKILLQSGRGVNGQCFRAGLNTCMLWFKILILD